ncbi:MAG: DNA-processing protein DprA [Oscillospiraceae bacterium]|nr:DNA-processing protein DprA [Oscillospiraceae bacterium]
MAALKYWVWFTTLSGVGEDTKLRLLQKFSSPEDIYYADAGELALVEGISKEALEALELRSLDTAERILEQCGRKEIFLVSYADALYPQRLKNVYHPPLLLYGRGKMPLFDEEVAVAVVGTRECTPYGINCARELGYELTQQGGIIISGMARGIDAAAMEGALRFGGFTCGVLGGGVDVVYPRENRRLYEDVAATGVLLSEYPPGAEPMGWHFPYRNRIMSGLSVASVVIEAPEKSGALITAAAALEQGREVFAVPGPITSDKSAGCHKLIREGAGLVTCAWDILSEYESRYPHKIRPKVKPMPPLPEQSGTPKREEGKRGGKPKKAEGESAALPTLPGEAWQGMEADQRAVLLALREDISRLSDDVALETDLPMRRVLAALTMLEIEGYAATTGGRSFVRMVHIDENKEEVEDME